MSTSSININGEVRDVDSLTDIPDRKFRNAWVFDGDAIVIDENLAKPIWRTLINEERERRKHLPVIANLSGDVIESFADGVTGDVVYPGGYQISMDMRDDGDRVNLLGLTTKGSLLLSQSSSELTEVYTADDRIFKLTASQLIELGVQAGNHDGFIYEKAREIKAMDPIPEDFATNETYWSD